MNARRSMIPAFAPNAVAFSGIPDERASSISRSRACRHPLLCVPKIRFCNIDGEGRQGQVVRRRRRGAQSRDGEGRPCSEIGLAAWFAFTMPSALILFAFAMSAAAFTGPVAEGFLHGLKLVAVAVVAQAIWGMTRTLTPDRARAGIALAAIAIVVFFVGSFGQIAAIALGACAGLWLCGGEVAPHSRDLNFPVTRRDGVIALILFTALLLIPPLVVTATGSQGLALFDAFYRSGALVFGGGHVVLPLLQAQVVMPGWVSNADFLAGYGVAQAVPGLLLVYGMLPYWDALRLRPSAQAAMRGTNAAVVGILGAALYNPVWTSAVLTPRDFAVALAGFLLLTVWKLAPWIVVVLLAATGPILRLI